MVDAAPARVPEEIHEQAPQIARARAVAVTRTASSHRLQPGDLVCGACGEGNPHSRRFCSRCGASLVEAATVEEPWWRRFVPKRGPRVVRLDPGPGDGKAGGTSAAQLGKPGFDPRSALRQAYRKGRIVAAVAALCAGTLYGTYPPFRTAVGGRVRAVKARVTGVFADELSPIHAVSVTANAAQPDHPALSAADELLNTYWLAPWSASPAPTLTFAFSHHVTLNKIILHSGASDAYIQDGRPSELRLMYSNGESFTILPKDTSQAQTFSISHADLITSMRIQVGAVYPGSGGSTVAIAEIELFGLTT
ncbi:NADase-type glycan-binding domain-containing protein [Kitasatospora sp. NPDC052896]|uniref:NADase-type glycan-binding domain-containing protein n=1 Tax=Kitasatospora sp. NPDC052896 TaxID=3364061 RepID=UPI0037CAFEB1